MFAPSVRGLISIRRCGSSRRRRRWWDCWPRSWSRSRSRGGALCWSGWIGWRWFRRIGRGRNRRKGRTRGSSRSRFRRLSDKDIGSATGQRPGQQDCAQREPRTQMSQTSRRPRRALARPRHLVFQWHFDFILLSNQHGRRLMPIAM